jgi:hypothetical protein
MSSLDASGWSPTPTRTLRSCTAVLYSYQLSQRCRKKIEELFGEAKDWHGMRRFRRRGLRRVREATWMIGWVLNLKRLATLQLE